MGKVVFSEKSKNDEPEHMTISVDAAGEHLITATEYTVRYRPLKDPDTSKRLLVPRGEIMMRPRSFLQDPSSSNLLLRSSSNTYSLDPTGKNPSVLLDSDTLGIASATGRIYQVSTNWKGSILSSKSLGPDHPADQAEESMTLPADWVVYPLGNLLVTSDGNWLLISHEGPSGQAIRSVIDWRNKKVVWSDTFRWSGISFALSHDEKRLVIGGYNHALYIFDFEHMCNGSGKIDEK